MSKRIPLEELESYLWNSAVLLRTSIDAGAYKQYVFPLLFFKRICDVYDEEKQKSIDEYGEDFPENHTFIVPEGAHWNDVRAVAENVGLAIVKAFRAIEKENVEKLAGVFGDGTWTNKNRLPDRLLKDLLEHFSSKTLSIENCPEDELGQGYEYLIKKFADDSGHTAQEFYTNRTVVHLMTEMLRPQSGESIYDPTCGSAGMLISCIAYLKEHNQEWRNLHLYGQEINQLTAAIGKMNLFLHGIKDFQIANDDTLTKPLFVENGQLKQFDIVLANPPYSIKQWDRAAFETDKYGRNFLGTPPQARADYAFIQHIIRSLNPRTGRCAILLPHGVLNRTEESELRERLVRSDYIECIIGLGRHLFYNSGLESCILICNMNKPTSKQGKMLFIDAECYQHAVKGQSYLYDEDIEAIMSAYRSQADIEGLSRWVTVQDVLENRGNLNIKLYVCQQGDSLVEGDSGYAFEESFEDFLVHSKEYWQYAPFASRFHVNEGLARISSAGISFDRSAWRKVRLSDIASEHSERIDNPAESAFEYYIGSDCIDGFDYRIPRKTPASKITSAQKVFHSGDYLLVRRSLYGSDFRERAPRADFDGICSADILTIRENPEEVADGFLIAVLYCSRLWDYIVSNSTGSLTRRIKWKQLQDFELLLPPISEQEKMRDLLWRIYDIKRSYRRLIDTTDELVKSQFIEMFGDPIMNPIGWPLVPLKDCLQRIDSGKSITCESFPRTGNAKAILKLSAITYGEYAPSENKQLPSESLFIPDMEVLAGDLLFSRKNTLEYVGITALVKDTPAGLMLPDLIFRLITKETVCKQYLHLLINHPQFRCMISSLATGTAGSMPNISKQKLTSLSIPLPPIEVQKRIEPLVAQSDKSKFELKKALESLDTMQKALVADMFQCHM